MSSPAVSPAVRTFKARMRFVRATKNRYVYVADDAKAAVGNVYGGKAAFGSSAPSWILVEVQEHQGFSAPAMDRTR